MRKVMHTFIYSCAQYCTRRIKNPIPLSEEAFLNCLPFDKNITQKGKRGIPFQSSILYRLKIGKQCRMKCVTFINLITYRRKY